MTKKADISKGDTVEWTWGSGKGEGEVTKVHRTHVERTIKGHKISRKASDAKPAVEVETDKGARVLKSVSEVTITSRGARRRGADGR